MTPRHFRGILWEIGLGCMKAVLATPFNGQNGESYQHFLALIREFEHRVVSSGALDGKDFSK